MADVIRRLSRNHEAALLVVTLVVCLIFAARTPWFLTVPNWVDLIESYSVTMVLALGLFVVLVSGGIDISFMAVASVAQFLTAYAATKYGLPAFAALPLGLAVGLALGALNATLIHVLKVTSIIITISTMSAYFALLMYFTEGKSIYNLPDWWGTRITLFEWRTAADELVRITLPIAVMCVAAVLTWALMRRTTAGRQLYAMGGNPEAARRIGVNIGAMHYLAYGYLGVMAAAAGLLQAHRVGESVPNAMYGQELNVLAACVLGGASLNGGIGTVPGVLLGVLLLAILQNGLNLMGVSPYFFQIIIGAVILISTSITGYLSRPDRLKIRRRLAHG
jgi:simple sugar transport system permease protein